MTEFLTGDVSSIPMPDITRLSTPILRSLLPGFDALAPTRQSLSILSLIISRGDGKREDFYHRGKHYLKIGEFQNAAFDFTRVLEMTENDPPNRSSLARKAQSDSVSKGRPHSDLARRLEAQAVQMQRLSSGSGKASEISEGVVRLFRSHSNFGASFFDLAFRDSTDVILLYEAQKVSKTVAVFAYAGRGDVCLQRHDFQRAIDDYTVVLELVPEAEREDTETTPDLELSDSVSYFRSIRGVLGKSLVRRALAYLCIEDSHLSAVDDITLVLQEEMRLDTESEQERFLIQAYLCAALEETFEEAACILMQVKDSLRVLQHEIEVTQDKMFEWLIYSKLWALEERIVNALLSPRDYLLHGNRLRDEEEYPSACVPYMCVVEVIGPFPESPVEYRMRRDGLFGLGTCLLRRSALEIPIIRRCLESFTRCLRDCVIVPDATIQKECFAYRAFCHCRLSLFENARRDLRNSSISLAMLKHDVHHGYSSTDIHDIRILLRAFCSQLVERESLSSLICCMCQVEAEKLLRCSRCKCVHYCSVKCQRVDWMEHKKRCSFGQRLSKKAS